jgi:hypothetical protein
VQDVYASLHTRWTQIAASEAILSYVHAAVLNGCRSVLRRRGIARRVRISAASGSVLGTEYRAGPRTMDRSGLKRSGRAA